MSPQVQSPPIGRVHKEAPVLPWFPIPVEERKPI